MQARLFQFGEGIICAVIIWLGFKDLVRLPLDADEVFSVALALRPWRECWLGATADITHPPVFTSLLKIWILIGGHSRLWLRLLPVLASFALLIPLFLLLRHFEFPRGARLLALAAIAASSPRIEYSQVVRSYALFGLAAGFAIWLFARNAQTDRVQRSWTVVYLAAVTATCCLHYFGLWVLGIHSLLALLFYRRELGRVCLAGSLVVAAYLTWLPFIRRVTAPKAGLKDLIGWIERPTLIDGVWIYHTFLGGPNWRHAIPIGMILVLVPMLLLCRRLLSNGYRWSQGDKTEHLLIQFGSYSIIPVVGTWLLSRFGPISLFGTRVLIFMVIPYCLLVVAVAWLTEPQWFRRVLCVSLFVWCFGSAIAQGWRPERSPRWDDLSNCTAQDPANASVPIVAAEPFIHIPLVGMAEISGHSPDRISLNPQFEAELPERFWAGYRVFKGRQAEAGRLTSRLNSLGYVVERRCQITVDPITIVLDLNSKRR